MVQMNLNQVIGEAVASIKGTERKRKLLAEKLLVLKHKNLHEFGSKELIEQSLIFPMNMQKLNCIVAGVDSGFLMKSLHAADMLILRTCAAIFTYAESALSNAQYYPNLYSFPVPELNTKALEKHDLACSKSLKRLYEEAKMAKEVIEKFSPHVMLIDGSIIPQYADKPRAESCMHENYRGIINEFQSLYETSEKNSCELIACVKDSRGSRFRSIIQEEILPKEKLIDPAMLDDCFDSNLLDYLLQKGERSFAFAYTKSISEHPVLHDFSEEYAKKIFAFYMKPSALDRPLRVEFLHSNGADLTKHTNEIASAVYALSSLHREFAYPSVLIEADLRARLRPEEVETVYNKIIDKLGRNSAFMALRRNSRPFK